MYNKNDFSDIIRDYSFEFYDCGGLSIKNLQIFIDWLKDNLRKDLLPLTVESLESYISNLDSHSTFYKLDGKYSRSGISKIIFFKTYHFPLLNGKKLPAERADEAACWLDVIDFETDML